MTRANVGIALIYRARSGAELLVRLSDLFTDYRETLRWFLDRNGGLDKVIEPSMAEKPYGQIPIRINATSQISVDNHV